MCGRFVVANAGGELVSELGADLVADDLPRPSYNVAPTDQVAIMVESAREGAVVRRVESARWGLIPPWAKDLSSGARAINARSEELESKRLFQNAFRRRRAVVPATGYYEWRRTEDGKTPHFIRPADGGPLLFAGLYEWWKDPAKDAADPSRWVLSFTILTRAAAGAMESLHDRMPVCVSPQLVDVWLDPAHTHARDALDAVHDGTVELAQRWAFHPVGAAVGNVRNDGPELIEPVA